MVLVSVFTGKWNTSDIVLFLARQSHFSMVSRWRVAGLTISDQGLIFWKKNPHNPRNHLKARNRLFGLESISEVKIFLGIKTWVRFSANCQNQKLMLNPFSLGSPPTKSF